jgi:hypothetical protein
MFNLEPAITEWRRRMLTAGIKTPVPLEELEIHLREEIERQMKPGLNEQQVFNCATRQIGEAGVLKSEFTKVGRIIPEWLKHFLFTKSGIPNSQLATNMNTSIPKIEPRWATYAKAGTFLFPAIVVWLLTVVLVLPKAVDICQVAGTTVFTFSQPVPAVIKAWSAIGEVMIFLTKHVFLIGGVIILAFVLLERYFSQWPRYRRAAIGSGAFILNAAVLLSLTIMIVSILVAAPALRHHIK